MRRFVTIFTVTVNLVLADAVTKELAEHQLGPGGSFEVLANFFNLALVHNRGCAWGMFQGQVWPLGVFGVIALAFLVWKRKQFFAGNLFCECLLYAGIVGNVIDRFARGYVIDFFDFHWYGSHFPCFNLADTYISVAAGLLILMSFLNKEQKGK